MALMRLDKFLSDQGVASRKELRSVIRHGRVSVDGTVTAKPETKIDSEKNKVYLDGTLVSYSKYRYFMLHKPCGVVTATEDKKQDTVLELLSPEMRRMDLFPVGRLDKDTSGLLLLTNDGDFAHRVISPKFSVEKRYYAEVEGKLTEEDEKAFKKGIELRDGLKCRPAQLIRLGGSRCQVVLTEGKYHQVRRMLASLGKPVAVLKRLSIGSLELDENLAEGGYRELTEDDLCKVFSR